MAKPQVRLPSKQKLLYQRAWLKAYSDPDGLRLTFKTKAGAFEARRNLYDAVREVKQDPAHYGTLELAKAAEFIQIVWAGETSLWLRHRDKNDANSALEEALGVKMVELLSPEEIAAEESMRRLLGEHTPTQAEAPSPEFKHYDNQFYGKRG